MERSLYIVRSTESGAASKAALECFKAAADTDTEISCRHAADGLEVEGAYEKIGQLIRNAAANPEVSSVYLTTVSPEHGACPRLF